MLYNNSYYFVVVSHPPTVKARTGTGRAAKLGRPHGSALWRESTVDTLGLPLYSTMSAIRPTTSDGRHPVLSEEPQLFGK